MPASRAGTWRSWRSRASMKVSSRALYGRACASGTTRLRLTMPGATGFRMRVVGRIHVDLAAVAEPLDAAHVLDQGQPPQPVRPHQPERARHHRSAPVGAHHQPAAQLDRRAVGVLRLHAPHAAALHDQPGHAMPLAHVHRQRPRPLQQDAVEDLAPDRERVIAIPAPRPAGRIRAVEHGAVGRDDAHAARAAARPPRPPPSGLPAGPARAPLRARGTRRRSSGAGTRPCRAG